MEIIANRTEFNLDKETAVAIGKFDGVHMGHRRILQEILKQKERGLKTCVFTFEPSPTIFFGGGEKKELSTKEEKRKIFQQLGVDILIEFPMNSETVSICPKEFVRELLVKRMNTRFVAAGTDLSFGNKGMGNEKLLKEMGKEYNFAVKIIDKISLQGIEISSSCIRKLIEAGKMSLAGELLGNPFSIMGTVEHGNQIGRTMGFPTVNLLPSAQKLLPPNGVYQSRVLVGEKEYDSITNIGCKPTVSKERIVGVESYLYDFSQEIYGREIEVSLLEFMRPEQQFAGIQELKAQLQRDIAAGHPRDSF